MPGAVSNTRKTLKRNKGELCLVEPKKTAPFLVNPKNEYRVLCLVEPKKGELCFVEPRKTALCLVEPKK